MTDSRSVEVSEVTGLYQDLLAGVRLSVIGQDAAIRLVFVTLACGSHSLIEGVPGVAKTLLVRSVASCLGIRFGRVQFTPDLMPSDIIGTPILDPRTGELRFRPGPLFTDLLLADEINRASAKTQAALLEAMQERAATVDGKKHALGGHFAVFATQNPVEQEGTYPLPEAQLDRFLFKIVIDYPNEVDERALLERHHTDEVPVAEPVQRLTPERIDRARAVVRAVGVRREITEYVASSCAQREPIFTSSSAGRREQASCCCVPRRQTQRSTAGTMCCPRMCRRCGCRRSVTEFSSNRPPTVSWTSRYRMAPRNCRQNEKINHSQ